MLIFTQTISLTCPVSARSPSRPPCWPRARAWWCSAGGRSERRCNPDRGRPQSHCRDRQRPGLAWRPGAEPPPRQTLGTCSVRRGVRRRIRVTDLATPPSGKMLSLMWVKGPRLPWTVKNDRHVSSYLASRHHYNLYEPDLTPRPALSSPLLSPRPRSSASQPPRAARMSPPGPALQCGRGCPAPWRDWNRMTHSHTLPHTHSPLTWRPGRWPGERSCRWSSWCPAWPRAPAPAAPASPGTSRDRGLASADSPSRPSISLGMWKCDTVKHSSSSPCSVKPSLHTASSGLRRFSAAANQSSVEKRTVEPRLAQLRLFSSVHSGAWLCLGHRGYIDIYIDIYIYIFLKVKIGRKTIFN